MNTMKCEICSGNDIVKQDGMYVCQHCGTKYSVGEAKKLLVEENVEFDNSDKQNDLYSLARSAKAVDDSNKAAQYYRKILLENPDDWEATFYSIYYEVMDCQPAEIYSECRRFKENLTHILELVPEKDKNKVMVDIYKDIDKLVTKMRAKASGRWVAFHEIKEEQIDYFDNIGIVMLMLFEYGDVLERRNLIQDALIAWEKGVVCYNDVSYLYYNFRKVEWFTEASTLERAEKMLPNIVKKVRKYRNKSNYKPLSYSFVGWAVLICGLFVLLLSGLIPLRFLLYNLEWVFVALLAAYKLYEHYKNKKL